MTRNRNHGHHSHGGERLHDNHGDHGHSHSHSHGDHHHHHQPAEPSLTHSYLVPRRLPSRSSIRLQPLEELPPAVREKFERVINKHQNAHREPFVGVTESGSVVPGLFQLGVTGQSLDPLVAAARSFLAALSPAERDAATFHVDALEWRQWSNGHANHFRHGACLHYMTEVQRRAAMALLSETLSSAGYKASRDIMRLNEHVLELTGRPDEYGEWHYFVSIFGTPGKEEPWGWQLDGHHLIVNCVCIGDQMVMTPNFMGSEPVFAESGKYKGTRVFEREEALGFEMMRGLSTDQRNAATLSMALPQQLFTIAPFDNALLENKGVEFGSLDRVQRDRLVELIEVYTGRARPEHAAIDLDFVKRHLRETKFSWCGPCDEVSPFYYRVQSPVIVIEFDHQSGVAFEGEAPTRQHIHTIVRTPNGNDYAKDLLRQHYLQAPPGHSHERSDK